MSVSNQMIIQNFNYEPCSNKDEKEYYAKINLMALQHAMKDLTSLNALRLWLYLSKNKENFKHLELSSKDCTANWGLGSSQFKDAKNALIDKGYLVPYKIEKKTTWYDFIQNPDSVIDSEECDEEELVPDIGILLDDEIPDSVEKAENPDSGFDNEIPETGKLSIDKIPETEIRKPENEQNSPEIIEEILQYNTIYNNNNTTTFDDNEWPECRDHSLNEVLNSLGGKVIGENDNWTYVVVINDNKEIRSRFRKKWDVSCF